MGRRITADAGVVAADAVAAPTSAGASGVASWLKRPQLRGVKQCIRDAMARNGLGEPWFGVDDLGGNL